MDIQPVTLGRIATVRLGPNEDLVTGLEQAAAALGFRHALVRNALGSLTDAAFHSRAFTGPAIELLSVTGEITADTTALTGLVADRDGAVWAGAVRAGPQPGLRDGGGGAGGDSPSLIRPRVSPLDPTRGQSSSGHLTVRFA